MCQAFPPTGVCSANGFCSNVTNSCICTKPGFSSIGDFRFKPGVDCDIYLPAIEGLWITSAIFGMTAFICSLAQISRAVMKKGFEVFRTNTIVKIHTLIMTMEFFWFVIAVWRVSDLEHTAIGMYPPITFFMLFSWCLSSIVALSLIFQFYTVHLAIIRAQDQHTNHKRMMFRRVIFMVFLCFTIPPIMGVYGLYYPDQFNIALQVHYIFEFADNVLFALLALFAFTPLLKALDESIQSYHDKATNLKSVRKRISVVRRELGNQPFTGGVLHLIFAFWPYLRNKAPYQIPAQILLWMILCLGVSIMMIPTQKENTTAIATATAPNNTNT